MREDEFLLTHVYNSVFIQENASSNTDPFPLCGSPQFLVGIQSHPFKQSVGYILQDIFITLPIST